MNTTTTYLHDVLHALRAAGDAGAAAMPATRAMILNADTISEPQIEAFRAVLKADGFDGSIISKYCGKSGLWRIGRDNPEVCRDFLNGDGAKLRSVQTLYTSLRKLIKAANAPESASSGDDLADAESRATAEAAKAAEAAGKSIEKAMPKLTTAQLIGALMTHATSFKRVADRLEFYRAVGDAMADAHESLSESVAKSEADNQRLADAIGAAMPAKS